MLSINSVSGCFCVLFVDFSELKTSRSLVADWSEISDNSDKEAVISCEKSTPWWFKSCHVIS